MAAQISERLARVAAHSTARLTHHGRKTGKPYEVTIWFAVDGEASVGLSTMNRERQWTRNVVARPEVALAIGDERFAGRVRVLERPDEQRRVYERLVEKYWVMWLLDRVLRLIGRNPSAGGLAPGRGAFYRVELT